MWTVRLHGVPQHVNDKAVTIKGKVYAFGYFDTLVVDSRVTSGDPINVYTFDAASHRWDMLTVQPLLPNDRPINANGRSVVAYGSCAYMWGGWHTNPMLNGLYRFDTRSMTWSRPKVGGKVPKARIYHSACVLGHRMYIVGGSERDTLGYTCFLDLESFNWHLVPTSGVAPTDRCCHTASAIGTRMYVWGGNLRRSWLEDQYDNSLYYLETETATWVLPQVEGAVPEGREHHCTFVYDRKLYIFGGYNELLDTFFADMHRYDPENSRWDVLTPYGSRPTARCCHGCSVLAERVFVFSGIGPGPNNTNEEHLEDNIQGENELKDMHVLHLAPTLKNLCLLAVIDADQDVSGLPGLIRNEINAISARMS